MPIRSIIVGCLTAVLAAGLAGCKIRHRDDHKVIVLDVPAMASPECRTAVLQALKGVGGIEVTPLEETHQLEVKYFSRVLEAKNVIYTLTDAGFDVNDNPGKPEAKANLPVPCR